MKKRNIIIMAVIILIFALIFAVTSCAPNQSAEEETIAVLDATELPDTEIIEIATEPTETAVSEAAKAASKVAIEQTETEPDPTQPVTTSKSSNSTVKSKSNTTNSSGTATVIPATIEPVVAEPSNVTPSPTPAEPQATEPMPTEHIHSWQEICHAEISYEVVWYVCQCGARFESSNFAELQSHCTSFSGAEVLNHTGYGTVSETIIDTPAYSTWVCTCGATSDTQP